MHSPEVGFGHPEQIYGPKNYVVGMTASLRRVQADSRVLRSLQLFGLFGYFLVSNFMNGRCLVRAGRLPLALTVMRQRPTKILIVSKWSLPAWPANQTPSQKVPLIDPNVSTEMICRPMLDDLH